MENEVGNDSSFPFTILPPPPPYMAQQSTPPSFMLDRYHAEHAVILLLAAILGYFVLSNTKTLSVFSRITSPPVPSAIQKQSPAHRPSRALKPTQWYRELFYKLQNLEDYAEVLPAARDELLAMFSRSIDLTMKKPQGGIFSVENYSADNVERFMEREHEECLDKWGRYLKGREQGSGPELFQSVESAKSWVLKQAPVKFVDGAWLAHLHKITTPFALRGVTKNAWQVLSEELGDGDLSKHHVYLYNELLKDVGKILPKGHSAEFIKPEHWEGVENRSGWQAAVSQLLISLFPDEFLPEILGFNMHYELITMDTLRANHELKEMGINPYYFLIHIVIDNGDSGHTAMAVHTVIRYLDMIRETEGEAAVQQAWKRVQVGYTLSQTGGESHDPEQIAPKIQLEKVQFPLSRVSLDPLSARIVKIFRAKALVSHQFHAQCRARIGGQTLANWLAPNMWKDAQPERGLQLLTALSQARPWIIPGASNKSLLMRELAWEGRMFGAFTHDETAALGSWIDSLGEGNALLYWNFTSRSPLASKDAVGQLQDPVRHHPVVMTCESPNLGTTLHQSPGAVDAIFQPSTTPLTPPATSKMPDLIALWFAHIGLLENTINTPARTADPLYANIICLLRAQAGFEVELPIVAGMDELRRTICPSLVDIGRELISRADWQAGANVEVESLHDVLLLTANHGQSEESSRLAQSILAWATRPEANLGLLTGLAFAFLELKESVASSPQHLAPESRCVLTAIVSRERKSLQECAKELRTRDVSQYHTLLQGYQLGRRKLEELCSA